MKKLLSIALLFVVGLSSAQTTKNLGDFSDVKVFDQITVELIHSTETKAEITGKRSGDVEFVNKNGQLKIRMKLPKLLKGEDIDVKLYYTNLNSVDVSEGASITSGKTFAQTEMSITAKEGGQIRLSLDLSKANVKSVTGGIIKLSGKATNLDASLGTGGILEAEALLTVQTKVGINAGGEADVNASELVDANIKAGGTVTIYGRPKQINKKTTLGGTIEER